MNPDDAWAFIVKRYEAPGRADELLAQQARSGLDIVLHLFLEYVKEREGVAPDDALLARAREVVAAWRSNVIIPLRTVRGLLKQPDSPLGAPVQAGEDLRAVVKDAELRSERIELDMLCQWWQDHR
jgi:uncharacterized protein (TIGR02444 family)